MRNINYTFEIVVVRIIYCTSYYQPEKKTTVKIKKIILLIVTDVMFIFRDKCINCAIPLCGFSSEKCHSARLGRVKSILSTFLPETVGCTFYEHHISSDTRTRTF